MRIIDSHTHLGDHHPEALAALIDRHNMEKFNVLAIPCYYSVLNTLECLLVKRIAPGKAYVYGGMAYPSGTTASGRDHEKQLELMMEAGCDGWKILESKPSVYRELQIPLDGEVFSRAFAMAERESIPITWHAGDPATFWDAERAPKFAAENGWLCIGEGFPALEKIYTEVENVMMRHPDLHVSMAHLYFTSDDRPHAERMLDAYGHFWLDITPGTEMYQDFLNDRAGWKSFFEKYQDKLVFGTDFEDDSHPKGLDSSYGLILQTLTGEGPVNAKGISGSAGLGLSIQAQEKIFAGNFERRVGPEPRPLSESGLNAYVNWLMPKLTKKEQKQAEALLAR